MMKKDDYRTEFEEQRQEININEDNNNGEIPSRVDLHRKGRKPKKRSGPKLINILFGLFTLIPVGILIFVIFSWNSPTLEPIDKVEDSQFQFETSGKSSEKVNAVDEENEKPSKEDLAKEEQAKKAAEEEQARKEQEEQARIAEEEQARKAQEAQAKKEEEERAKKEQEKQAEKEEKSASRTHTVAAGETLYRISVNYYKSGDGVSKIMQANGLSSNEIVTGQTLVIP